MTSEQEQTVSGKVEMIPKNQAETMMMHLSWANRNMMIAFVAFALAMVTAIYLFVTGYTSRTDKWLNALTQLQSHNSAVTEVQPDGLCEQ